MASHIASIIGRLQVLVKGVMPGQDPTGHDWDHVVRVATMAAKLAKEIGADSDLAYAAALLHDVADHKFHGGDREVGPRKASELILQAGGTEEIAYAVASIVRSTSWSGGLSASSLEGQCVQDADRLDAIGSVGIARCFAYGGHNGRPLSSSIEHFHEKLLLIKDRMNTEPAKVIAEKRHRRLVEFLQGWEEEMG